VRARIVATFAWCCLTVKPSVRKFLGRFDIVYRELDALDYDAMPAAEPAAMPAAEPAAEVYRRFTDVERTLLAQWGRMAVLDNVIMLAYGVLYLLTNRWLPDAPEWFRWHVVKVGDSVESTLPARRLTAIAAELSGRGELANAIRELPPREAYDWLRDAPGADAAWLRGELADYIREYGYRSANELKLEEPDLREDPTLLMSMLRDALSAGPAATVDTEDADGYLDAHLRGPRRWVYERARRSVRTVLRERERVRFARTRAFGMARRMFTAIGAGLTRAGALSQPRDVFFPRLEELRGAFTGTTSHRELRPLAELRRVQQDKQRRLPAPPPRFVTVGGPYWGERRPDVPPVESTGTGVLRGVLRGTPSSPGVVTGEARVLTEPRDAGTGIVVTYRTDPGWVGVLSSAKALLIERGSPLTHVAIVARELGVPTIVQIPELTARVRSGMRLTVDGAAGTVRIHDTEAS
jgi:pyruvate,water dikinase